MQSVEASDVLCVADDEEPFQRAGTSDTKELSDTVVAGDYFSTEYEPHGRKRSRADVKYDIEAVAAAAAAAEAEAEAEPETEPEPEAAAGAGAAAATHNSESYFNRARPIEELLYGGDNDGNAPPHG